MKKVLWLWSATAMLTLALAVPTLVGADASFEVSNLSIIPTFINEGQSVTISTTVTNTGDEAGSYTVNLNINESLESTKDISLEAGASEEARIAGPILSRTKSAAQSRSTVPGRSIHSRQASRSPAQNERVETQSEQPPGIWRAL